MDVRRLGLVPYREAWGLQQELAARRRAHETPDTLLLLEHPHVYTIGRRGTRDHVYLSDAELDAHGITCLEVDRGGDVTYHGPGQLVGYPILDLGPQADVWAYLRTLEACLMESLAEFGIQGERLTNYTGVWIQGRRKIAAIGVKVAHGITTHGFALNVNTELSLFDHILACGIRDAAKGVTSMERELGRRVDFDRVMDVVAARFRVHFLASEKPAAAVA